MVTMIAKLLYYVIIVLSISKLAFLGGKNPYSAHCKYVPTYYATEN